MAEKRKKKSFDFKNKTLEECFDELDTIVANLENENTSLEKSVDLFERGIALSQHCRQSLTDIEQRIKKVISVSKGKVTLEDVEESDETENQEKDQ